MKKYLSILLIFSLVIFSCKKEKVEDPVDDTPTAPPPAASFTMQVDGSNFTSTSLTSLIDAGEMKIEATDGTKIIRFTVTEEGIGSFLLGNPNGVATGEYLPTGNESDTYTISGLLTISNIDNSTKKVSGSFKGEATGSGGTINLENGTFINNIYTGNFTGAGINVLQEGAVDLDGAAFSPTLITGNEGFGKIAINLAKNSGTESIGLSFDQTLVAGEYDFTNPNQVSGTYIASGNPDGQYAASSGDFVLTSYNLSEKNIKGIFNFQAIPTPGNSNTNNHQIQNATFSINY